MASLTLVTAVLSATTSAAPPPRAEIYLGDGCFWERQYAYVQLEMKQWNRSMGEVTSQTGYAGSKAVAPDGLVCYHHDGGNQGDDYSVLNQTEVTRVLLDNGLEDEQFHDLVANFFHSFVPGDGGAGRPDPGDMGAQYRSVLGLPHGTKSPWYPTVEKLNQQINNMTLVEGTGGEDDAFNVVYIYDSLALPFHRAEQFMQFHCNFSPPGYGPGYLTALFDYQKAHGLINTTGCPEGDRNSFGCPSSL